MISILINLASRFIVGPGSAVGQWVLSKLLKYGLDFLINYFRENKDKKDVDAIKKAEDKLKDAKTEKEVDNALSDIVKHSSN